MSRPLGRPVGYVSPPSSPPTLPSATALSNIMTTCRSLQSLIAPHAPLAQLSNPAPSSRAQLPTPPMSHAPLPMKLPSRSRPSHLESIVINKDLHNLRNTSKRCVSQPGVNKRRRAGDDHTGSADLLSRTVADSDANEGPKYQRVQSTWSGEQEEAELSFCPSTPKRARIAPEQLPLGLERSDYHDVFNHTESVSSEGGSIWGTNIDVDDNEDDWIAEDDHILVELVLEKVKLSKSEWQDCARSLGTDRHSVHRRWKRLIMRGEVGVKTPLRSRRARLHSARG
ncbi:hypothetical protein E4U57_005994 [Claviceps arundinis]|uniref:Myb-like domain-containing protein n=1 Tax=Claviceps arundinis TaxID=1623583 RepID=A0A9P7MUR9_9HYPO|nr:hypothetical protein E4U57_005994 [Claviceps arundinis]KAG5968782.1 hypothetical protein E4U56_000244 [Claviceps arundinis]